MTTTESEFKTYLREVFPNVDQLNHVLDICARIYNGQQPYKKLYIFSGIGGNGKTTFINIFKEVMGHECCFSTHDIATPCPENIKLMIIDGFTDDITRESPKIMKILDENEITIRERYSGETKANFDIILCTNRELVLDPGMLRRTETVSFESRFVTEPNHGQLKARDLGNKISLWAPILKSLLGTL